MKKILVLFPLLLPGMLYGQGCIPVRNLVGFGQFIQPEYNQLTEEPLRWVLNVNSRYYKIAEQYIGNTPANVAPEDLRVNKVYVISFSLTRFWDNGWSATIDVPLSANSRETWQEHNPSDKVRHTVHSFGINDIRITGYKWLWDPTVSHRGNVQAGFGIKLPSGDYQYQDVYYKASGKVVAPVDQTIQLGDGGTGFTVELNSFFTVSKRITAFANLFYLLNPREHNGVSTTYGFPVSDTVKTDGSFVNSVPDAYTIRIGANLAIINRTILWLSGRLEGQPTYDLIGGSNGNRRAGKIISVEPGINYRIKNITLYAFLDVPVYRATQQTVPDKIYNATYNKNRTSGGGFADYLLFAGATFKL